MKKILSLVNSEVNDMLDMDNPSTIEDKSFNVIDGILIVDGAYCGTKKEIKTHLAQSAECDEWKDNFFTMKELYDELIFNVGGVTNE